MSYQDRLDARRVVDGVLTAVNAKFHNANTYVNHGCRCPVCGASYAERNRRRWATRRWTRIGKATTTPDRVNRDLGSSGSSHPGKSAEHSAAAAAS